MELAKIRQFQLPVAQVNAARMSHFLDAETGKFSHVPSLSMGVHGTLRYLNLTYIN